MSSYILIDKSEKIATRITKTMVMRLSEEKNNESYIFKIDTNVYHNLMLKYPLCSYYKTDKINIYTDEVWQSINAPIKKTKLFSEYIELAFDAESADYVIRYNIL